MAPKETIQLQRMREIEDLLQSMKTLARYTAVNGSGQVVDMVYDEVHVGFMRRPAENSYQRQLDEEEFFLTYQEAKEAILETIKGFLNKQ